MLSSQILFRIQGDIIRCPEDGSALTPEVLKLRFKDNSHIKYSVKRCVYCGRRYIWIAAPTFRAIKNYYTSDEFYPKELRGKNDRIIETLYRIEPNRKRCPYDRHRMEVTSVRLNMSDGTSKERDINKCNTCGRKYIAVSNKKARLITNCLISNQFMGEEALVHVWKPGGKPSSNDSKPQLQEDKPKIQQTEHERKPTTADPLKYGLPNSAIVSVYFDGQYQGRKCYSIVSNLKDEDVTKGIYYLNRPTAQRILQSVLFPVPIEPQISRIIKFADYQSYADKLTFFCDLKSPKTVTVYQRKLIVTGSDIEVVTAFVLFANQDVPIPISVYYDPRSDRYFINDVAYKNYTLRYGLPYFHVQPYGTRPPGDWNLRTNSELNLFGYSVSQQSGVSCCERRKLLEQLIDSGMMSKAQIMGHLEWLISTRQRNPAMRIACQAWEADLKYISKYRMKNQRVIWGKLIGRRVETNNNQYRTEWFI